MYAIRDHIDFAFFLFFIEIQYNINIETRHLYHTLAFSRNFQNILTGSDSFIIAISNLIV